MPRLTEQEQQEIIRFIEADKPLPEKYRFLLFEDKRAVERNQVVFHNVTAIEVTPIIQYPPDKGGKGGYSSSGKRKYIPYNSVLTEKARDNRSNPTPAEKKMWLEVLRGRGLAGLKFTRQKPLDEFIVDFYCAELMLAIEIDGDSHAEQEAYDLRRTSRLGRLGIEIVRYTNQEVLQNLDSVYADLLKKVERLKNQPPKSPFSGGLPKVAVELTDFSVFYSQDSIAAAEASLKNKRSKIVVERGQIVKVSKDKDGIVSREVLTKNWTDWIDYWSVDFNFESKREIIRIPKDPSLRAPAKQSPTSQEEKIASGQKPPLAMTAEYEEVWAGDFVFENEWQSFRIKKDRSLELKSVFHECEPGRRKIAVKVVDIFGNDTMTIVEVTI